MDKELKEYIDKKINRTQFMIVGCTCLILSVGYSFIVLDNSKSSIYIVNIVSMLFFLLIAFLCIWIPLILDRREKQKKNKLASPAQQG